MSDDSKTTSHEAVLRDAGTGQPVRPACSGCGGPHCFDTTIPSPLWNRVIRGAGLPDYLCTSCIVKAFVKAGEGYTAELWGDEMNGVALDVRIGGTVATSAAELGIENTQLRAENVETNAKGFEYNIVGRVTRLIEDRDALEAALVEATTLLDAEMNRDVVLNPCTPPERRWWCDRCEASAAEPESIVHIYDEAEARCGEIYNFLHHPTATHAADEMRALRRVVDAARKEDWNHVHLHGKDEYRQCRCGIGEALDALDALTHPTDAGEEKP